MTRNTSPPADPDKGQTQARLAIHFNWEDWLPYLETAEISEDEKRQCIEALWAIIHTFIDLKIPITSHEDRSENDIDLTALLRGDLVQSDTTNSKRNTSEKEEA